MRVIDKSSTSSARRRGKKMTNLSKELCEICGIEPKKVEKRCKECNLNMEECGCFDCYKEIYPDFEQPENFFKLFNLELVQLQWTRQTLATLVTNKFELTVDSRHFISQVIRLIQYALYYQVDAKLVKQAIRAEEWKYE